MKREKEAEKYIEDYIQKKYVGIREMEKRRNS